MSEEKKVAGVQDQQGPNQENSDQKTLGSDTAKTNKLAKKTKIIIAVVVAAVLVLGGLLAWFLIDQHNKAVWEQEHKEYPLDLTIVADGYDAETSSPIPIQIEGTDFESNSISIETLVSADMTEPIKLMRGTYTISVSASPFLEDGSMFDVSAGTAEFEVVGDSDSGDQGAVSDNQADASNDEAGTSDGNQASTSEDSDSKNSASITIDPLPVEDMTEDMISASSDKLLSLGCSQEAVTAFSDAAQAKLKAYQDELAAKKAEEEAAKKAAEKAAQRHVSTDWYEFDIPEQWIGKVEWRTEGTRTLVHLSGYPAVTLVEVYARSTNEAGDGGDIAGGSAGGKTKGTTAVDLWAYNWAYWAAQYSENGNQGPRGVSLTESQYDQLLNLSTGGELSYSEVAANPSGYETHYSSYIQNAIEPTLVVKDAPLP
ncbi:putative uncharacterized protein [Eggerthella sp. CAG:1427]|nr:putative uncharacterized protein [Eggerthella sp. CAG:1427]